MMLFITLCVLTISCQQEDIDTQSNFDIDLSLAQENDSPFSNEILQLINNHRISEGLNILMEGSTLATAYAVSHTNYMIEISQINHDNFQIRSAAIENDGAKSVGENVAFGYNVPENVVTAWLNSPSHKETLEGNYSHASIGVKYCEEMNTYYFTHILYRI